ncbi:GerMN domain-containing protein [Peribacillus deserti]|uniref:Negative regulator of sigma-X activity n=1 Tax=Peribacillus deserti TaxID=673318 RepID=A0A2N5M1N4_9BACI|nr:GerMN domain-containing protein [Peribacillus deserti]PLT28294.1 hypothetical protein CUU66_18915 [Peribacillus deserti]
MKRYEISDHEIQEAFKMLPKITDNRDKEEIFRNITRSSIKRKKTIRWMPAAASIAAIILFSILASSYILPDHSADEKRSSSQELAGEVKKLDTSEGAEQETIDDSDKQDQNSTTENNSGETEEASEEQKPADKEGTTEESSETVPEKKDDGVSKAASLSSSLAFSSDTGKQSYITLAVPDKQIQYIVPITFETEKVEKQELLNELLDKMNTINEEDLGLMDFYPLNLSIALGKEEGTINIDFTDKNDLNNLYEFGLKTALEDTFRYQGFHKITFSTEGKPGVELPESGMVPEMTIEQTPKRSYLIYQAEESKPKFLVPNINAAGQTIEEAIKEMQNFQPVNSASPSIPGDMKIDKVAEQSGRLTITLSKETPLKDDESSLLAIEAILLTAKDFGLSAVLFENPGLSSIGPYDLTKDLEMPAAPNKIQ